jgi:hypothetical protein
MDNNLRNIDAEIEQVLRHYRTSVNSGSSARPANEQLPELDERSLLLMLYEVITEYNNVVRTNTNNMRRYHENITTFTQLINTSHSTAGRHRRQQYYNRFPQNNNSVPHSRFWTYPNTFRARNHTDTIYTNIINETIHHFLPNTFQDVQVRPTEEQINNATETFDYITGENLHTTCPITLDEFRESERVCRINHCGHLFRETAIKNWFRQNVRCPVCRYDIRTRNETEPGDDEDESEQPNVDLSLNPLPTPVQATMNRVFQGIQGILQNYINSDVIQDPSLNRVFSFEIPVYIYNDLSGNHL